MESIAKLQQQAEKVGGEIILLAGNHEDMAIAFLTNRKIFSEGTKYNALDQCLYGIRY